MTLHRPHPSEDWREVKIVCALPYGQFLVEEADRALAGRFPAFMSDLRETGGTFEYGEAFVSKAEGLAPDHRARSASTTDSPNFRHLRVVPSREPEGA